jgi:hypothetical protein
MTTIAQPAASVGRQRKIDVFVFLATALAGLGIWLAVAGASGTREAWDSDYFYNVGFPCMAFVSGLAGFLRPTHAWRWGIATVILQPVALYWGHSPAQGGFEPISLFFFVAYAVALAFCAVAGAKLHQLRN